MSHRLKWAPKDGVLTVRCAGWPTFVQFVDKYKGEMKNYAWRGQGRSEWALEPTLDRVPKTINQRTSIARRDALLAQFRFASRGRRPLGAGDLSEHEWWALGQHYGLKTPLLDWTLSPFIAAFFAFAEANSSPGGSRAIFAISVKNIREKGEALLAAGRSREDIIRFINPLGDDNARLINQRGLFTQAPRGMSVEQWVTQHFDGYPGKNWIMVKIELPDKARSSVLRSLERMGISPLQLFPDLTGASRYCNLGLEIEDYVNDLNERDLEH